MAAGFDNVASATSATETTDNTAVVDTQHSGSGERWILFKMNVQLDPDADGNPAREETIVVHVGDIALEVATQFCLQHGLAKDFIPILTDTIQQQIHQVSK